MKIKKEEIRDHIRRSYEAVALKGSQGCGCGCGGQEKENQTFDLKDVSLKIGYAESDLSGIPQNANMGLGCGNPIILARLREGETVLDLGSGGGFDCFLARKEVGDTGFVIGVDMTPEMIRLSRENAQKSEYTNVEFRLGEIEHLPVSDESVDVIISNCVINLSLEKEQVFKEAYRVLKNGGRLSISDVVATAEMPENIKQDLSMMAGCISGAAYFGDIESMLKNAGFSHIKMYPKDNSSQILKTWAPDKNIQDFVASFIIEARKE